jgi:hypothetical protein
MFEYELALDVFTIVLLTITVAAIFDLGRVIERSTD